MKATVQVHLNSRDATVSCEFDDSQLRSDIMSFADDIKAEIQALKDEAASEHTQVMAAIDALQAQVVNSVSDADKADIMAAFADAKAAIGGVYESPAPPQA